MKILILQNRMGIGDMIMFLPFIEAISKRYKTPVTILAKRNTKVEMYFNNKEIVEEIMYLEREDNKKHSGVKGFFKLVNDQSVINSIFSLAGYTYGPLLGLFSFGIFTRRIIEDQWVPLICALAPIFCYVLSNHSDILLNGYQFGFELLLLNGTITFIGLWLISKNQSNSFTGSQKNL